MEDNQEMELLTKDRDQIVLELESTRNQLEKSKETIVQLTNSQSTVHAARHCTGVNLRVCFHCTMLFSWNFINKHQKKHHVHLLFTK